MIQDSILPECWSYGQKSQRSQGDWLECTTSCTNTCTMHGRDIKTQCIGVDNPSWYWERINILSDSIEWKTGEVSYEKSIHVTSTSAKDLIENTNGGENEVSDHAQRAGSWAANLEVFQSNQPTLNPIRERSGRLGITHDVIGVQDEKKKTSRFSGDRC